MNADFFFKFAKFKFGSLVNAEDFADKMNYQWTGAVLIISTALIAMRQYIFTPIQCWVPPEWPRPWEEYTENYCWVQSTYHVSFNNPGFPEPHRRKEAELNYYQWVPFMLALEAMLVYVPHFFWKVVTQNCGYNPNAMVKFAMEAATIDQDKKKKLIGYLARQIGKCMECRREWRDPESTYMKMRDCCKSFLPCFWFGKRSGTMLVSLYVTNKLIYLGVAISHIFLMQFFLGFKSFAFGFEIIRDLINKKDWEQTLVFPRVTFCDVPFKVVGQWNVRSVQCVLPVNLLNEKIYIFLWFWSFACMFATVVSAIVWILRLFVYKNRQNFIKKYLKILNSLVQAENESEKVKEFVRKFLRHDGIFILMMISANVGDVCAAEIVCEMFKTFCTPENKEDEKAPLLNHTGRKNSLASKKGVPTLAGSKPSAPQMTMDGGFIGPKTIV